MKQNDWVEDILNRIMNQMPKSAEKEPVPGEFQDVPRWNCDISKISPSNCINELANYIGSLKLSEGGRLAMVSKAMPGLAGGWFKTGFHLSVIFAFTF